MGRGEVMRSFWPESDLQKKTWKYIKRSTPLGRNRKLRWECLSHEKKKNGMTRTREMAKQVMQRSRVDLRMA